MRRWTLLALVLGCGSNLPPVAVDGGGMAPDGPTADAVTVIDAVVADGLPRRPDASPPDAGPPDASPPDAAPPCGNVGEGCCPGEPRETRCQGALLCVAVDVHLVSGEWGDGEWYYDYECRLCGRLYEPCCITPERDQAVICEAPLYCTSGYTGDPNTKRTVCLTEPTP